MLVVKQYKKKFSASVDGYIEEGVVRRELADNFCYYNEHYDSIEGNVSEMFYAYSSGDMFN